MYSEVIRYFLKDAREYRNGCPVVIHSDLREAICSKFNIPVWELLRKTRKKEIVDARRLYFYILVKMFRGKSYHIGLRCGFDHATVIYSVHKCEDLIYGDRNYRYIVNEIMDAVKRKEIKIY